MREGAEGAWRVWIDTGGTFTDCVAVDGDGRIERLKVLSDSSLRGRLERCETTDTFRLAVSVDLCDGFLEGGELRSLERPGASARILASEANGRVVVEEPLDLAVGEAIEVRFDVEVPLLAAAIVTGARPVGPLPGVSMRLATTRATNALLERSGGRTAFLVTRGFADLLRIGSQQRDDLFALEVRRDEPFYEEVFEIEERLDAAGEVIEPLGTEACSRLAARIAGAGFDSAAVAFLHAYLEPRHEIEAERALRRAGLRHVSRSSAIAPLQGALARAQTTVVDAYLAPVVDDYFAGVEAALPGSRLRVMTSSGGLRAASEIHPKDCLLSGPAGGVVGAARAGTACGRRFLVSFDMGGTSTDVARYDGELDYRFETRMAGARVLAPALAIETVAAGGGSICRFDGRQLRVGPQSAGARPGPACYGAGGPLTLTDVNLLLGRLDPDRFEIPLARRAAEERLNELLEALASAGQEVSRLEALEGWLRIADERMAEAIRRISVRQGYDPTEYTLVTFGGAGGQHACSVATQLGMGSILVPADAGLLSAWGLGHAVVERIVERQVLEPVDDVEPRLASLLTELADEALAALAAEGVDGAAAEVRRTLLLARLEGQDTPIPLEHRPGEPVAATFRRAYRDLYGYDPPERRVELESIRLVASSAAEPRPGEVVPEAGTAPVAERRRCYLDGDWREVDVHLRAELAAGQRFGGPALVVERFGTLVVAAGWRGRVAEEGALSLERAEEAA